MISEAAGWNTPYGTRNKGDIIQRIERGEGVVLQPERIIYGEKGERSGGRIAGL